MKILNEAQTIAAAQTVSISRFGDGELRLAVGGDAISQRTKSPQMMRELTAILGRETPGLLVCIPDFNAHGPRQKAWAKYNTPRYSALYGKQTFGSAFITRPDNAPWINTPEYWEQVRSLWRGKDVTLVVGDRKSITEEMLHGKACAKSIRIVWGPRVEAYAEIDRIEEEVGKPSGTVLMCLGVTATILAWRLAQKGVHALDLGHIGMFMKRLGQEAEDQYISDAWRSANRALHDGPEGFGGSGWKHAEHVLAFAKELKAKEILDYGCGEGTLKTQLKSRLEIKEPVWEYDPAIPPKSLLPKPAGLVVCTDVLEHVEPSKLDNVLRHLYDLTISGAYIVIATRQANKIMPDGSNAHKIVEPPAWWLERIATLPWKSVKHSVIGNKDGKEKEVRLWVTR